MASCYELRWLIRRTVRKLKEKDQKREGLKKDFLLTGDLLVTANELPKNEAFAEYTVVNTEGRRLTYRSFYQWADLYGEYSIFCRHHGCAVCTLTTLARIYDENQKDATPDTIIEGLEKQVVGQKNWTNNYRKMPMKFQNPITLYGITQALQHMGVKAEYVHRFTDVEARKDILSHLQTGNPVVIEVGRKNYYTGEINNRWTNSFHTMILIGLTRDGKVLVNDSANRSWYEGPQRFKLADLEDLMAYMFSCTEEPKEYSYCGMATDGGYIKIG